MNIGIDELRRELRHPENGTIIGCHELIYYEIFLINCLVGLMVIVSGCRSVVVLLCFSNKKFQ